MKSSFLKSLFFAMLSLLLSVTTLITISSCSKDDVIDTDVIVDANGIASGGHRFTKIDENHFYIDDIKYTVCNWGLSVTGYNKSFFKGEAKIINALNYRGSHLIVKSIDWGAFQDCTEVTSVTIPSSVDTIGLFRYYYDENDNTKFEIGCNAFLGCSNLASIKVGDGNANYDSRKNCNAIIHTCSNTLAVGCKNTVIPNSVTRIGARAFYGCSGLTSITIPNNVTSIGWAAFHGCSGLTTITIPNSVTSINKDAFLYCSNLTSVIIGKNVLNIGDYAFFDIEGNLTEVYCYAENVPSTGHNVFGYDDHWFISATLHVPVSSIEEYKTTTPWSYFKDIVAIP